MKRTYLRKRAQYTTFGKLSPGDRFRFDPQGTGPFTKFDRDSYEDSAVGDDRVQTWLNVKVKRLPRVGIEPN